jgi:tetratricopeptide (TPR) repeat protein
LRRARPRGRDQQEWAITQSDLGVALATLGSFNADKKALLDAAAAFRAALEVFEQEQEETRIPTVLSHLGNALKTLGTWEPAEIGHAHLVEAVSLFHDALSRLDALEPGARAELSRFRGSLNYNLAGALVALGQRQGKTAHFRRAAEACETALKVQSPSDSPLAWAETKRTLAAAQCALAAQERSPAGYQAAAQTYRDALKKMRQGRAPERWVELQKSLGDTLWLQSELERRTDPASARAHLRKAMDAYRAALEEWPAKHEPNIWAATQTSLGNALFILGQEGPSRRELEDAIAAYDRAVKVFEEQKAEVAVRGILGNRERAARLISQLSRGAGGQL